MISPVIVTIALLILLAMSSALALVVAQNTGSRARLKVRLAAIGGTATERQAAKKGANPLRRARQIESKLAEAAGAATGRRVELRLMIEQAGMTTSVRKFYIASGIAGVIGTALYFLFGYPWYLAWAAMIVCGVALPRKFLKSKAAKRQKNFTKNFADALDVIVRGIRSGLPVGECVAMIARESPEPVCTEFRLLIEGQRLGMTLKQALERSCRRMPTADMKFFAIVLNLQQQTGGNLAETLAGLSDVLRQRKKMADKVKAMSSEARMTATIIGSMPFLISGMIYLINPDYISLLWTDHTGKKIFYGGLTWMTMGVMIMRQMISFEI
ncbi:MAG TPA: type II secretion system F family protein [Stellaceae bacterium]|nr:type II secretion system F family protein [Stellaceae bacterium]